MTGFHVALLSCVQCHSSLGVTHLKKNIDKFVRGFKREQQKMMKGSENGAPKKRQGVFSPEDLRVFRLQERRQKGCVVTVYRCGERVGETRGAHFSH